MPNWCSTKYVVFTDNDDKTVLQRFYNNLTAVLNTPSDTKNSFDSGCLSYVAIKHGLNGEDIPCRGTIEYLGEYESGESFLSFETETAWGPCDELWDTIIGQYEGVSHVYISEEPGMGYFVNTDTDGRFLPEKYLLDLSGDEFIPDGWYSNCLTKPTCLEEHVYFDSFEGLMDYCTNITGKEFATLEELRDYFSSIFDEDSNVIAVVREFTET